MQIKSKTETLEEQIAKEDLFNAYDTANELILLTDNIEVLYKLGVICSRIGKVDEAIGHLQKYIENGGNDPFAILNLGHMYKALRNTEVAAEKYRQFISKSPENCGHGFWHLVDLKDNEISQIEIYEMQSALENNFINSSEKMLIQFALGNYYERKKQFQNAFNALNEANKIHSYKKQFNHVAYNLLINDLMKIKKGDDFDFNTAPYRPIFILGLPRSGSTLCEQILSSHSSVIATDELPFINAMGAMMEHAGSYAKAVNGLSHREAVKLRESYFQNCSHYISTNCQYFIDKSPINSIHIGLIKKIIPEALVINTYRNTLDNAVSVYKRYFFMGHEYTSSFKDISNYMTGYVRLMKHWEKLYSAQIYHCRYEDLVSFPEKNIRNMLSYCELPFENKCLSFYENSRAVLTPSSDQVSKPIYSTSIKSWEKYSNFLTKDQINMLSYVNYKMIKAFSNNDTTHSVWNELWAKGVKSNITDETYTYQLNAHWNDFSNTLEPADKVLDLCTGNGYVLNTIRNNSEKCTLIGIDLANVQSHNKKIKIIENIDIEQLPFEDKSFTHLVSQFGLEFSNLNCSIKEISRVLGSKGKFSFIFHYKDSVITNENTSINECLNDLINKAFRPFEKMLKGLDLKAGGNIDGDDIALENRNLFNHEIGKIHENFKDQLFKTKFPETMKLILQNKNTGACTHMFSEYFESMIEFKSRIKLQIKHALSDENIENLVLQLKKNHFNIYTSHGLSTDLGEKIGWILEGQKH